MLVVGSIRASGARSTRAKWGVAWGVARLGVHPVRPVKADRAVSGLRVACVVCTPCSAVGPKSGELEEVNCVEGSCMSGVPVVEGSGNDRDGRADPGDSGTLGRATCCAEPSVLTGMLPYGVV
jgi:hypothetical protein